MKNQDIAPQGPVNETNGSADDKDILSQKDIQDGNNTLGQNEDTHAALENKDGKNNGAEPAAYRGTKKMRT